MLVVEVVQHLVETGALRVEPSPGLVRIHAGEPTGRFLGQAQADAPCRETDARQRPRRRGARRTQRSREREGDACEYGGDEEHEPSRHHFPCSRLLTASMAFCGSTVTNAEPASAWMGDPSLRFLASSLDVTR